MKYLSFLTLNKSKSSSKVSQGTLMGLGNVMEVYQRMVRCVLGKESASEGAGHGIVAQGTTFRPELLELRELWYHSQTLGLAFG